MTDIDPARPLKEFKPKHKFFVGIDSDGCAFDTMGIKQRECFGTRWSGQLLWA
ncbi:MAG: hypothetical protein MUP16_06585 [Sedimentisphaerales bacterium]|nr:hypothetical protein [Sedimentisphaerales bacterium]